MEIPDLSWGQTAGQLSVEAQLTDVVKPEPIMGSDGISRIVYTVPFVNELVQGQILQIIEEPNETIVILKIKDEHFQTLMDQCDPQIAETVDYSPDSDELQFPVRKIIGVEYNILLFTGKDKAGRDVRTVRNKVYIEFKKGSKITRRKIEELLGISNPDIDEEGLKQENLRTMYRLQTKSTLPEQATIEVIEVFPGYSTPTVSARATELSKKFGEFCFSHTFIGLDPENAGNNLVQIIRSGGLLSSDERSKRHLFFGARVGFSPSRDFRSGGAGYVFTNIIPKGMPGERYTMELIIDPEIANRLDWFSYPSDSCGADPIQNNALTESPDEALKRISSGDIRGEQIFCYGIGLDYIMFCSCGSEDQRTALIRELKENGIEYINGKPIEDWIVVHKTYTKVFDQISIIKNKR